MAPKICSAAEAMAVVKDNDHVATYMWGLCGTPGHLYHALAASSVKNLTLYIENFLPGPPGTMELGYPDPTMMLSHVKKLVTPYLGGRAYSHLGMGADFLGDLIKSGKLETEATTHGVFLERLHAGAMGLGGFYSPIGLGTTVAAGKEIRIINGKEYIFEMPIRPDVGLIKAARADKLGNLVYHGTIDDSTYDAAKVTKPYLENAVEALLAGKTVPDPETKSVGCGIKFHPEPNK